MHESANGLRPNFQSLRVDHRRLNVGTSVQIPHRTNFVNRLEEVRPESMSKRLRRGRLDQAGINKGLRVGEMQR